MGLKKFCLLCSDVACSSPLSELGNHLYNATGELGKKKKKKPASAHYNIINIYNPKLCHLQQLISLGGEKMSQKWIWR